MNDFLIFNKEKEKTFKQEYLYAEIPIYHQYKENKDKEDKESTVTIIQIT